MVVDLFDEDLGPAEVERLTLTLRRELLDLDEVEQVAPGVSGPAPPGSRAIGLAAIGSLLVTIKPTAEVISKVVGVLRDWMASRKVSDSAKQSTMRITVNGQTLELTPTAEQQATLVAEFLRVAASTSETPER
jgi:hypothetical protein